MFGFNITQWIDLGWIKTMVGVLEQTNWSTHG